MRNRETRTLRWRGVLWLLLLAPLFFMTYGQVNTFTATRDDVGHFVYGWESAIPFLPWTIVPYWSIDLLYGLSLFICTNKQELNRHGLRLLAASLVACIGFLLYPLQFSWPRPETKGVFGWLFQQLEQFDLPYNQAPSLHIILAWLLWLRFRQHVSGVGAALNTAWFGLIAVSVLTTWQHHFIDVLSGGFAGVLISYCIPMTGQWRGFRREFPAYRLARRYMLGALLCVGVALLVPHGVLWVWPALALALVSLAYLGLGEGIFQKDAHGNLSLSARILLFPYLCVARISRRYFCRNLSHSDEIYSGISIGYYPQTSIVQQAMLDLTAEYSVPRLPVMPWAVASVALLDLKTPELHQLRQAVSMLQILRQQHATVLVHCALGLSRSAVVVAAWLIQERKCADVKDAVDLIRGRRPSIHLTPEHLVLLQRFRDERDGK